MPARRVLPSEEYVDLLSLVRQIADTVTVLRDGAVVEEGRVEDVFARPVHAYTKALLAAIPAVAGATGDRPTAGRA